MRKGEGAQSTPAPFFSFYTKYRIAACDNSTRSFTMYLSVWLWVECWSTC